ncbi:MAG: DUF6783 domain-containing protein [Coprococcus comes]
MERFRPDEGAAAATATEFGEISAKWACRLRGMIFQTRSSFLINTAQFRKVPEIGFLINPKGLPFLRQSFLFISVNFCLYLLISAYICLYLFISVYSSVSSSVTSTTVSRSSGSG